MCTQWDGINLIGPCWFSVLCNDGIMLLREVQRGFYTSRLSGGGWTSQPEMKPDREDYRERKAKQKDVMGLKAGAAGRVAAVIFILGQIICPNDNRLL